MLKELVQGELCDHYRIDCAVQSMNLVLRRCPMECRLTQKPNSVWHCQVLLRRETDRNGKPLLDIHEIPFGDVIHSTTQLEDRLRRAQLAILNPDTSAEVILSVKESDLQNYPRQLPFSSNVVCVDVWGPDVPDLSFIDLPGLSMIRHLPKIIGAHQSHRYHSE